MLTLQDTTRIHDALNRPKIELIAYIYILFSRNLALAKLRKKKTLAKISEY